MATIHFTLQGKGGVGKSVISAWLTQFLLEQGFEVSCMDTDPSNATFAGYREFNVQIVDIMTGNNVNVQEVARSLLTPDECARIPGITFESGNAQPGDMLIFVAGNSPIYGKQSLYFIDPTFMARAKIEAPAETDRIRQSASISSSTPNKKEPENKENQVVSSSFSTFLQEEE